MAKCWFRFGYVQYILIYCVLPICWAHQFHSNFKQDPKYIEGRDQYQLSLMRSHEPRYGKCYVNALSLLETGCKSLTDDVQHRLALKFANCLFLKNGMTTFECHEHEEFSICTKGMSPEAFMTYTHFYTHTQNMCFFLEAQAWQEQTDFTIHRLSQTSADVVEKIDSSSQLQNEFMIKQEESINNQKLVIERGSELKSLLENSTVDVHSMLNEFKASTLEQRQLIFEVFDKLSVLQETVLGEFTGFYSFMFYGFSILICYLLTSTPRTSGSRFWLFVVMTCNMVMERSIAYMRISKTELQESAFIDENTIIYGRLWWCRKIFTSLAILIWVYFACTYKDINKMNNMLLEQIRKQNSDLKRLLQLPGTDIVSKSNAAGDAGAIVRSRDLSATRQCTIDNLCSKPSPKKVSSSTGYESDTNSSSDSQASDRTYIYNSDADVSMNSTFMLSSMDRSERESTPMLLDELRELRQATPLREMTPVREVRDSQLSGLTAPGSGSKRDSATRGRKVTTTPTNSTYNLRSRKKLLVENPIIQTESASDFSKVVRHLSSVSNRNLLKVNATIDRHEASTVFSSDDD